MSVAQVRKLAVAGSIGFAATVAMVAAPDAWAQAWPTQPVKLVLGTATGGAVDALGRIMAAELTKGLGQPVVVENRGGANGNIAGEAVARAAPDGYTLLQTSGGTLTTNPHLYAKMGYDPLKDLVPITQVGLNPLFLVVRNSLVLKNLDEFIGWLKANPGKASYGSAGNGSALHITQEAFAKAVGVSATQVPYKGAGPALADLLAGQIDFMWDPGPSLSQVRAGKLRLLAVAAPRRVAAMPDSPTVAESGVAGFDGSSAHAMLAPSATPRPIIDRVNRAAVAALQQPEVRERFRALGIEPIGNTPEQAAAHVRAEHARLGALVKDAGIRLE